MKTYVYRPLLWLAIGIFAGILILGLACKLTVYETIYLELVLLGLIGLLTYVQKTTEIAEASARHNDIITRPAVTVSLIEASPLDHLTILVQNHTALHANTKILIEYEVKEVLKDMTVQMTAPTVTGAYNGIAVWNTPAKDEFYGHTKLEYLKDRQLRPKEVVILNISAEVSPFDKGDYRPNPLRQYRWSIKAGKWVPYPVTQD